VTKFTIAALINFINFSVTYIVCEMFNSVWKSLLIRLQLPIVRPIFLQPTIVDYHVFVAGGFVSLADN